MTDPIPHRSTRPRREMPVVQSDENLPPGTLVIASLGECAACKRHAESSGRPYFSVYLDSHPERVGILELQ